jgi:hypothetical protein
MLKDFELIKNESTKNIELFLSNPVNSFILTKQLTKDLKFFKLRNNSTETQGKILNNGVTYSIRFIYFTVKRYFESLQIET